VRAFPVFGRVKEVQWVGQHLLNCGSRVADGLRENGEVTKAIVKGGRDVWISFGIKDRGWTLTPDDIDGDGLDWEQMREWTKASSLRPTWDCYQAVAEALLAIPMPAEE
jgi:hypothetical protein